MNSPDTDTDERSSCFPLLEMHQTKNPVWMNTDELVLYKKIACIDIEKPFVIYLKRKEDEKINGNIFYIRMTMLTFNPL